MTLLLEACRLKKTPRPAVWFMRQAGRFLPEYRSLRERYGMLDLCRNPELAAQVTLMPIKRFKLDAAIIFADILLIAQAMGVAFHFAKDEGPVIADPIRSGKAIERLRLFDPEDKLNFVLKALRLVRAQLPPHTALIGFAGAPFTVASYLVEGGYSRDFQRTKTLMLSEPKLWKHFMEKLTQATIRYLKAQAACGAQVVQLFDSWVGALSPLEFKQFVLPYSRRIVKEIRKSGTPVIYFGTQTAGFLNLFSASGADIIGVDWRVSLRQAWKQLGPQQGIQGNLDPAFLLAPPALIQKEVQRILQEAAGQPGHIFNLGHGILPQTPLEGVQAAVQAVHQYRK